MRIAVIGAGNVGGALGGGWAKRGHEVMFGLRDPSDAKAREAASRIGPGVRTGGVAEAAAFGEAIALTVPWPAAKDAIRSCGNLAGKTLLDCTNPLKDDLSGFDLGGAASGAEQVAEWASGANVVKIFNTTGFNNMADPAYPEGAATMFYCGGDNAAKRTAAQLAKDLGFDPVDAGPLKEARLLEALALLWIHLAVFQKQGTGFAFRMMRR